MGQGPDGIRRDIEATRRRMDRTLDQLEDRVSPRRIAHRRGERLRAKWADLKETMMGNADEPSRAEQAHDTARDRTQEAQDTMRDRTQQAAHTIRGTPEAAWRRTGGNPLAAGAIAFGVGMLAASLLPRTRREQHMTSGVAERLEPVTDEASSVGREIMSEVQDSARQGVERTREAATGAAETVQQHAQDAAETVRAQASDAAETVRSDTREVTETVRSDAEGAREGVSQHVTGNGNGGRRRTGDGDERAAPLEDRKVEELQRLASERDIPGRSSMTKAELIEALRE